MMSHRAPLGIFGGVLHAGRAGKALRLVVVAVAMLTITAAVGRAVAAPGATIDWLGHSSFLVAAPGARIVTDPFGPQTGSYPLPLPAADVVTVSHEHFDHNQVQEVQGHPQIIRGPGAHRAHGILFWGIAASHDTPTNPHGGPDTIFVFTVGGITFCHLGDLGPVLTSAQVRAIGRVDVLMIPAGGFFTIDPRLAWTVVRQLHPRLVIPMHYKTLLTSPHFPIAGVGPFLQAARVPVKHVKGPQHLTRATLPKATTVMVFDNF